ncbi:speG [Acanthosepion pharaonis]|uniref:SpeG n=1 Tax=Acanthosepion pharaonis TaxID=158019 RepID=A0A812E8Z2_ACAPH|nr:speG [Sepia pharaonis]
MAGFIIRRATAADCEEICQLFQKQVSSGNKQTSPSPETLKKDGLGKLFHILVAEDEKCAAKQLIGYLFFHFTFSSYKGKSILLTDIYISPEFNKKSVATELFVHLCKIASEEDCARLEWAVREYDNERNEFVAISNATNIMKMESKRTISIDTDSLLESMAEFITRRATAADCEEICQLFQKQVSSGNKQTSPSPETLKKDGLGRLFHILIAEDQKGASKQLIGYLFFHFAFSSWEGKSIFLIDVYISPEYSKKSVAKELFIHLCKVANEERCGFLEWKVRENENEKNEFAAISNATNFMKEEGRYKFHLSKEKIMTF